MITEPNQKAAAEVDAMRELIGVLQGAEIELAESDGYDYGRPLGIRVAINSLLAGLGVEPKDLEGETGTAVDPALVHYGRELSRREAAWQGVVDALREIASKKKHGGTSWITFAMKLRTIAEAALAATEKEKGTI